MFPGLKAIYFLLLSYVAQLKQKRGSNEKQRKKYSNKRSGASVETARENGERRETVRYAYIKFVQNYPFFQQQEIPIGLILTQPVNHNVKVDC